MNNKRPKLPLFVIAFMGHVLALFVLWLVINSEDVQQPVFEKVISVRLTQNAPSHLPPINQKQRDEIAEEKRQKEEAERKRQEDIQKAAQKKRDDARRKKEQEQKKRDDLKKASDQKKLSETKKKKEAELRKKKAADDARRKKANEDAKKKKAAEAARQKKADADRKRRADEAARQKAQAAANRKRQTSLGQHANAAISDKVQKEWNQLLFSALQISDFNDYVKIQIKISKRAKSQTLNSNAQALFKKITSSSFRFPAFHRDYNKSTMTVEYRLRATD
jgi:TolA protein